MICRICNKDFPNRNCLFQHLKDVHKVNVAEYMEMYEGIIPIICDICGEKVTTLITLATHKKKAHGIKSVAELNKERRESIKHIKCNECGEMFDSLKNLSRHLRIKHDMTAQNYYIKYLMTPQDFMFCKECGKPNGFRFDRGFMDFCSFSCSTTWFAKNTDRIERSMKTIAKRKEEDPDFHLSTSEERYWVLKGYSEDEANKKVHERQKTFSKKIMIEKHGEEEGTKKWKERQKKWQDSYKKQNFSKISQELFWGIFSEIKNIDMYFAQNNKGIKDESGRNHEYKIESSESYCRLDFFIPSINFCLEFDGDYWHGEKRGNQERDRIREENIIKHNPNIKIYHVKEKDYKNDKCAIINYYIDLINKELNGTTNTKI